VAISPYSHLLRNFYFNEGPILLRLATIYLQAVSRYRPARDEIGAQVVALIFEVVKIDDYYGVLGHFLASVLAQREAMLAPHAREVIASAQVVSELIYYIAPDAISVLLLRLKAR